MTEGAPYREHFSVQHAGGVISLGGDIGGDSSRAIMDAYAQTASFSYVLVNVEEIGHIDISGIETIIKVHLDARRNQRRLVLDGVNRQLREIFLVTRLDGVIEIHAGHSPDSPGKVKTSLSAGWSMPVTTIRLSEVPSGAVNLNVDGLEVRGPLQGFGQLWEKIYRVRLAGVSVSPKEVISELKEHFQQFQPEQNRFYPTRRGIVPGEAVIINATTPGGLISTGVWVVYADEEQFTFMTPQGHPESGWVTFSAYEDQGVTVAQVVGFARSSDPLNELGFRIAGSRLQEKIWKHVLTSLAQHFGVSARVEVHKTRVADDLRWEYAGNIWDNAQIRTTLAMLRKRFL
ncbi:MAG TPA: anti-sigma factor antagonist [Deltaproteobacteria bacterium]|nr:anti-sigma factor antagonist [Deltaproteobacteria bacterium]